MKYKTKLVDMLIGKITKISKYLIYVLLILLALSIFRNISKIRGVYKQIAGKKADIAKLEQENKALEQKIAESKSDDYIEKQIRDKLGLAKEGEVVLVLPPDDVLQKYAPKIEAEEETLPDPNWKKWLELFGF